MVCYHYRLHLTLQTKKGGRQRNIAILQFNITKNVNKKKAGADNTALQHDIATDLANEDRGPTLKHPPVTGVPLRHNLTLLDTNVSGARSGNIARCEFRRKQNIIRTSVAKLNPVKLNEGSSSLLGSRARLACHTALRILRTGSWHSRQDIHPLRHSVQLARRTGIYLSKQPTSDRLVLLAKLHVRCSSVVDPVRHPSTYPEKETARQKRRLTLGKN
jgi:hypothetical protein